MIVSRSAHMVSHPRGSYIVIPHCCLWGGHTKKVIGAVIHKQQSRHTMPKSVLRAVFGRMQFTLHATRRTPHDASHLVQAMPAWLVKTRRAPPRHSRDARVYGHTTTAMHKLSTLLPFFAVSGSGHTRKSSKRIRSCHPICKNVCKRCGSPPHK